MTPLSRRTFMQYGTAAVICGPTVLHLSAQDATNSATLSFKSDAIPLPESFTGLSYESSQLSHPAYFSANNKPLVNLFRSLGSKGVLRIGGNTSDYDDWVAKKISQGDPDWSGEAGPDTGLDIRRHTSITESAIDELRRFLDATGWSLIYGVDLGHGSPASAAEEAAYVTRTIGSRLLALQIGNEPDLFSRNTIRNPDYSYANYFQEWKKFADAIRAETPDAPLAGPDIGNHNDWADQFAAQAKDIRLLDSHYYAEGPPASPAANIPNLLKEHPTLVEHMQHLVQLGKEHSAPYRMSECNSCYHGGKDGVSNTFASALWGADFMMLLASLGVTGVNFHGGGEGFYSPISGGGASAPLVAQPLYYGMLFFRELRGDSIVALRLDNTSVNAAAYLSSMADGRKRLAVVNKDLDSDLHLSWSSLHAGRPSRQLSLSAPSVDSKSHVTLGGETVPASGVFQAKWSRVRNLGDRIIVPKASGLLLEFV